MASADGRETADLNRDMLEAAYRFDFFQAVRLLEQRKRLRDRRPDDRLDSSDGRKGGGP